MQAFDRCFCTKQSNSEAQQTPKNQNCAPDAPHEPLAKNVNPIPSFVVNFDWAIKTSDGTSQSFSNNLH
jgi:hypothetical protein